MIPRIYQSREMQALEFLKEQYLQHGRLALLSKAISAYVVSKLIDITAQNMGCSTASEERACQRLFVRQEQFSDVSGILMTTTLFSFFVPSIAEASADLSSWVKKVTNSPFEIF